MRIRAGIWVRNQPLSLCSSVLLFLLPSAGFCCATRRDWHGHGDEAACDASAECGSGRTPGAWGLDRAAGPRVIEEEVRISELPTLRGWWSEQEVAG
jgi:hypothetical protein